MTTKRIFLAILTVSFLNCLPSKATMEFGNDLVGRYNGLSTKPNSNEFEPRFRLFIRPDRFSHILYSENGKVFFYFASDTNDRILADQIQNIKGVATGFGRISIRPKSFDYRLNMQTNGNPKEYYTIQARFEFRGRQLKGTIITVKNKERSTRRIRALRVSN